MTNAEMQPETIPAAKKQSPLGAFLKHQQAALEETGKAIVSLFPREFREHAQKAMDENRASVEVLWDGLIDGVESSLDKMRAKAKDIDPSQTQGKVKVDVE